MSDKTAPERVIRLVRPTTIDGVGVLSVRMGRTTSFYTLHEIPCEIGGRGFAVHKLGLGELYHVRVGEQSDCSCECLGFLRHGRCRHVLGLLALVKRGIL
jgi:SWIM zinc finger